MKKIVRLTESDLHSIVRNAVNRIIRENEGMGGSFGGGMSSAAPGSGGATTPGNTMQNGTDGYYIAKAGLQDKGDFYKPTLKRNKDEKNGSISMNRQS